MLTGKRAVFIGGSSGMGLASAKLALKEGAQVVIAARSREKLEQARGEMGGQVEALSLDATNEAAVKDFFQQVGAFDHLVTTITSGERKAFLKLDVAVAKAHFDGKFWGQWLAAKYGATQIRAGGSITFFSGIWSHRPPAEVAVVAAMNSGIEGLTRALAGGAGPPTSQCHRPRAYRHRPLRRHASGVAGGHVCRLRDGHACEARRSA